jgi:hypothetical protein
MKRTQRVSKDEADEIIKGIPTLKNLFSDNQLPSRKNDPKGFMYFSRFNKDQYTNEPQLKEKSHRSVTHSKKQY